MSKLVKFGGSSLANSEQYAKVINIISEDEQRKVVVVSAPGKRFDDDVKITDLLIQYATQVINKDDYQATLDEIISRYAEIANAYEVDEGEFSGIKDTFTNLAKNNYKNDEYLMAAFKANGERMNAKLMAAVLNSRGMKARFVDPKEAGIVLDDINPNAANLLDETYTNLGNFEYSDDEKLVFPGFFGYTKEGNIATFARGGSDITGSIVATGLHIDVYENFTDVSSIYAINPHLVDNPYPITKMSYREMRELAYAGFSVFNDEAIIPAIKGHVTINVKNTNRPNDKGTLIVPEDEVNHSHVITGISADDRFSALYLHSYLLNKQIGGTLTILSIFKKYGISYEHMPSGIDDLTIIFDRNQASDDTIHALCKEISEAIHPDKLEWIHNYALIMVVGENMAVSVGSISQIIKPLAEKKIPINMINQGASKIAIMIGIDQEYTDEAVVSIYNQFFKED